MPKIFCKYCETKVPAETEVCPKCGADPRPEEGVSPEGRGQVTDIVCLRCGEPLTRLGIEKFRIGGTSGLWIFFFDELAEVGERTVELEFLACRSCRHVEFRLPEFPL